MRRYTLKFQIVLLFFLISLPALALSLAASRVNMKEAQEQVVNVKQNSMKMLVKQYDTSLEAIENYIQLILYADNTYSALRLNEKDSRYQQARIWLRDELDNLLKYFPLAAGFYVRIPHNEDIYIVKQLDKIPLDAQEYLEEQLMRKDNFARPDIIEHGKTQYLLKSYSNQFVEIGYILQLNDYGNNSAIMWRRRIFWRFICREMESASIYRIRDIRIMIFHNIRSLKLDFPMWMSD